MPGDWMSVSTTPTRCPAAAIKAARFAVVFDFPVPPRNEWMEIILPNVADLREKALNSSGCQRNANHDADGDFLPGDLLLRLRSETMSGSFRPASVAAGAGSPRRFEDRGRNLRPRSR